MISPPIANGLNEKQHQSVTLSEDINALILAGAGSGKTRVLTHRIHYLVSEKIITLMIFSLSPLLIKLPTK